MEQGKWVVPDRAMAKHECRMLDRVSAGEMKKRWPEITLFNPDTGESNAQEINLLRSLDVKFKCIEFDNAAGAYKIIDATQWDEKTKKQVPMMAAKYAAPAWLAKEKYTAK